MPKSRIGLSNMGMTASYPFIASGATGWQSLAFTGSFEIVMKFLPETTRPRANKFLIQFYNVGVSSHYRFRVLPTGQLSLTLSANGSTAADSVSTVPLPSPMGVTWIRMTYNTDGTTATVRFYTAPDQLNEPTIWTQLGADVSNTQTSILQGAARPFLIGCSTSIQESNVTDNYKMEIYRLIMRNLATSTTVLDADFTQANYRDLPLLHIVESSSNAFKIEFKSRNNVNSPYWTQAAITGGQNLTLNMPVQADTANDRFVKVDVGTSPTITKTTLPFTDELIGISSSLHSPIWSNTNNIYIHYPSFKSGVQQSRVLRLNKSLVQQEDVQVFAGPLNGDPGHQDGSVAVDASGTIIIYPEGHGREWRAKYSNSANSLASLSNVAFPLITKFLTYNPATNIGNGVGIGDYTAQLSTEPQVSMAYNRYYRNPHNNELWLSYRSIGWYGFIRKWNPTNKTYDHPGYTSGNHLDNYRNIPEGPISGSGLYEKNSIYGGELAFASATKMYYYVEWSDGGTGNPRRDGTVMMSNDNGVTWTTMTGEPIKLPLQPGVSHLCFPTPTINTGASNNRSVVQASMVVMSDGSPAVISAYAKNNESYRGLYISRWIAAKKRFEYSKIADNLTGKHYSAAKAMTHAGKIYVLVTEKDEHFDPGWRNVSASYPFSLNSNGTSPFDVEPATLTQRITWTDASRLLLYVSANDGVTWTQYVLDDGTTTITNTKTASPATVPLFYCAGYFDEMAPSIDNKMRIYPTCSVTTRAELWEFPIL
jgi:hypothetical protein